MYVHDSCRKSKELIVKQLLKSIFTSGGHIVKGNEIILSNVVYNNFNTDTEELSTLGKTLYYEKLKKYLQNVVQYKRNIAGSLQRKKQKIELKLEALKPITSLPVLFTQQPRSFLACKR